MRWLGSAGMYCLLAEYFLKSTAVLSLALLAARLSRRRPASFRHFTLAFALIGLLLLPLLSLAPVGWRTSFLPARPAGSSPQDQAQNARNPRREAVEPRVGTHPRAADIPAGHAAGKPSQAAKIPPLESSPASLRQEPSSRLSQAGQTSPRQTLFDFAIAALWSVGMAIFFMRLAAGLAGARRLTKGAAKLLDPIWRVLLERFLSFVSLRRKISLKGHPDVTVPLTWGWRKPVILMPAASAGWSDEERSSALFHELSHVKRADFLTTLLVRMSLAVFWFNPLCWIACRELRKEREIACDELALRAGIKPSVYAASLLALRRSAGFRWTPSAALLGLFGGPSFPQRLAAILKQKLTFKEVKMKTKIMLAAAVASAVVIIGTARPAVGIEKETVAAALAETTIPAPESLAAALPGAGIQESQAEQAKSQEKEKDKVKQEEKEKTAADKTIIITSKKGDEGQVEITVTEGDTVKTITLDKPLTITSRPDGSFLVLGSDGKELKISADKPLHLEIKAGGLEVIQEGKVLSLGKGGAYRIIREGVKAGSRITWVEEEPGKPRGIWVVREPSAKPRVAIQVREGVKPRVFTIATDKELLDKIHEIQEQVKAVKDKTLDIDALEKSLEKLATELEAGGRKFHRIVVEPDKEPGKLMVGKKILEDKAAKDAGIAFLAEDEPVRARTMTAFVAEGDATIQVSLKGETSREAYDRAVARIKKDLPEGCRLDPEYDEESGMMTFKITLPEGEMDRRDLMEKLVEGIKEEVKK